MDFVISRQGFSGGKISKTCDAGAETSQKVFRKIN